MTYAEACVFRCADFGWRTFYFCRKGEKCMFNHISCNAAMKIKFQNLSKKGGFSYGTK